VKNPLDNIPLWLSVPEVAEKLNIPVGKVHRLIQEHSLIGVKRDGVLMVPDEIVLDTEPLPSLKGTILVLLDSGFKLEEAIEWLYTTSDVLETTPVAALLEGKKTPVRRLAQMTAL
jgi:hypothetical protein